MASKKAATSPQDIFDMAAGGELTPPTRQMYLCTKGVDEYQGTVKIVSAAIREHHEESDRAGDKFFLMELEVVDGNLTLVDKQTKLAEPAEPGDKFSVYVSLAGKKTKRERGLQDMINFAAAVTGGKEKDFQGENVLKVRDLFEDADRHAGTLVSVVSKPENKGYRNCSFMPYREDKPKAKK